MRRNYWRKVKKLSRGGKKKWTALSCLYVLVLRSSANILLKHIFKAGLFSAIGTVCVIGNYKWTSRNPCKETVNLTLIAQLLKHLVNISDRIPLQSVAAQRRESFKQTRHEVMVDLNVTWLFSVIICISCAAVVTLIQQWARRYWALFLRGSRPHRLGRLQEFMFRGPGRFLVPLYRAYQLLGVFVRLSLIFYCVGLIALIFHINKKSISKSLALGYILRSFLVYAITMVSPFYFFECPYGIPFTVLTWRLYHVFMFGTFSTLLGIADLPHTLSTLGSLTYRRVRGHPRWKKMLEERVNKHRRRLSCGLERRVPRYATSDSQCMNSEQEEQFIAWGIEFFNSYALSGAEETILPLMSDQSPANHIFGVHLHYLLQICIVGNSALIKNSTQRRRRLRVCLECLWCGAKAFSQKPAAASLPSFVPVPHTDIIYRLQGLRDRHAAIIARCFCALVAKELAADINSRYSSDGAKLERLSAILGRPLVEVEAFLLQPGAIGLTNILSLTSSLIKFFSTGEVRSEALTMFQTTVDILLVDDLPNSLNTDLPQDLISSFHQTFSDVERKQDLDWLWDQLWPISSRLHAISYERRWRGRGEIYLGQE